MPAARVARTTRLRESLGELLTQIKQEDTRQHDLAAVGYSNSILMLSSFKFGQHQNALLDLLLRQEILWDLLVLSLHIAFLFIFLSSFLRFIRIEDKRLRLTCGFSIGSLRESWSLLTRGNFLFTFYLQPQSHQL